MHDCLFTHSSRHTVSADYTPSCRARLRVSVGVLGSSTAAHSAFRCRTCVVVPRPSLCEIAPSELGGLPAVLCVAPRSRCTAVVSPRTFAPAVFELCWLDFRHAVFVVAVVYPADASLSLSPQHGDPLTHAPADDVNAAARRVGTYAQLRCLWTL